MTLNAAWTASKDLLEAVIDERRAAIDVYNRKPILLREHANQEESFRTGGYASRQLLELVQNAADAIHRSGTPGRIEVRIAGDTLYCANEGEPITRQGLQALANAYVSDKRGDEIGRFGLGFKSVLSVTGNPQVLSKTVSFEFGGVAASDPSLIVGDQRIPLMRMPRPIDAGALFRADPIAAEMATWATTIIRLPDLLDRDSLKKQLTAFSTEFLLFAPSVSELRLRLDDELDVVYAAQRHLSGAVTLTGPSGGQSRWLVRTKDYSPTIDARREVGEVIARESVRLSLAMRTDGRPQLGAFWAYFPLQDRTTASAIFNAPWRVNDDRTNLLDGKFNDEILEVFAHMFLKTLQDVPRAEDPARLLDFLPSRAREVMSRADRTLSLRLPQLAAVERVLPNLNGDLRAPTELRYLSPVVNFSPVQMQAWQEAERLVGDDADLPNATCYATPERRAKLRTLFELADPDGASALSPRVWLELVASEAHPQALAEAVRLLNSIEDRQLRASAAGARIIPVEDGTLAAASDTNRIFLGSSDIEDDEVRFVDPEFVKRPGMEAALRELRFSPLDPDVRLRTLLRNVAPDATEEQWARIWNAVDEVPRQTVRDLLERHIAHGGEMSVRCRDGQWRPATSVVLPGDGFEPLSDALTLDVRFHGTDAEVLREAGVICGVDLRWSDPSDEVFVEYHTRALDGLRTKLLPMGVRPGAAMSFREGASPGPLRVLQILKADGDDNARTVWTQKLVNSGGSTTWTVAVRNGPTLSVEAPHLWAANKFGLVETNFGNRPANEVLDPGLAEYKDYLPVALRAEMRRLNRPATLEQIPGEIWKEFLDGAFGGTDAAVLGRLLQAAVLVSSPQETVPAIVNGAQVLTRASDLLIASDPNETEQIRAYGDKPYVIVVDALEAAALADRLGARLASEEITTTSVLEGVQQGRLATDRFMGLRRLNGDPLRDVMIVPCEVVATDTVMLDGVRRTAKAIYRAGSTLYVQAALDDRELIAGLNEQWGLKLTFRELQGVLDQSAQMLVQDRIERCAEEPDQAKKLLIIADPAQLKKHLPEGLIDAVRRLGSPTDPYSVAELFLKVHGFSALQELKAVLQSNDLPAPNQWAGSTDALTFVRRLGFDAAYAGEQTARLERSVQILGKPDLNPLHDYQKELASKIRDVVRAGQVPAQKALVYLPTGAGKTRVTVEAVVRSILEDEVHGPVLWIAQSEELCEQAVQTWSQVWRLLCDTRSMSIGRLWGGNDVPNANSDIQVVVAIDATLSRVRLDLGYEWLRNAGVVIIDEAHRAAVAPTYTAIMRWLGVDGNSHERPLLGLTATPFRSNEESSKRLVARFDGNRLTAKSLGDKPYEPLQAMGVLARVRHESISGVQGMPLSPLELEELNANRLRRIPQTTLDRIARDADRTLGIVRHIEENPDSHPALVFTPNVLSAQILAALLLARNIEAAAISGDTRTHERRRVLRDFGDGKIQVITNCDVLTQGFDAPGVRSLYLARPTLSPNAYIQMVGRGLRGPENGGKPECLIVDVADTFSNFHGDLGFTQFDRFWNADQIEELA